MWAHDGRRAVILQFLRPQLRCQTVPKAPYKSKTRRSVLAMRKPRFIHSPATSSSPLAAPRFSRPIRIRYLPRLPYSSFSTRPPETPSLPFQDAPQPSDRRPAFHGSLVNLDDASRLASQGYLPFDQTQERTTQVRLDRILRTRSLLALFGSRPRAELLAAAARVPVASVLLSICSHGRNSSDPEKDRYGIDADALLNSNLSMNLLYS